MKRVRRLSQNMFPISLSGSQLSDKDISTEKPMRKSKSEPLLSLDYVTIDFEGDGPLGIVWTNIENNAYVKEIRIGTVASEEYELDVGYKLLQIGDYNCSHLSYSDIMNLIRLRWQKFSRIILKFEVTKFSDEDKEVEQEEGIPPIIDIKEGCPIYAFLKRHNAEEYYQNFIELGANDEDDLRFIEYQDLINMKMDTVRRKSINEELKLQKINVYFSPYMTKEEIMLEKAKYSPRECNFIEIRPPNN